MYAFYAHLTSVEDDLRNIIIAPENINTPVRKLNLKVTAGTLTGYTGESGNA